MKLVGRYLRIGQTLFDKFAKEWGQVYADQLDIRAVCKWIISDFIVECGRAAIVNRYSCVPLPMLPAYPSYSGCVL